MTARTLLLALSVGFVGCTEAHPRDPDAPLPREDAAVVIDASERDAGERDAGERDAPTDAGSDAPVLAFDAIYPSILVPRCGHCHVDEAPDVSHYTPRMTDVDAAYEALIDVPVETAWVAYCVPEGVAPYRVRPGDREASMLSFLPDCYVRDAQHDLLTEDELDTIRRWIAAGAPRSAF